MTRVQTKTIKLNLPAVELETAPFVNLDFSRTGPSRFIRFAFARQICNHFINCPVFHSKYLYKMSRNDISAEQRQRRVKTRCWVERRPAFKRLNHLNAIHVNTGVQDTVRLCFWFSFSQQDDTKVHTETVSRYGNAAKRSFAVYKTIVVKKCLIQVSRRRYCFSIYYRHTRGQVRLGMVRTDIQDVKDR